MAVNYVKFYRGTQAAYDNVIKNKDTLYFITNTDSNRGSLYLGEKLIAGDIKALKDLEDVVLNNLDNNDFLVYDENNKVWVNKNAIDAIGEMTGASVNESGSAGLVPAPGINQQDLFLKGDGTWATPIADVLVDNCTINSDNDVLSLKNFGKCYYKFIASVGVEGEENYVPAHYKLQVVDELNPWKENLQPKVVKENGQFVLGWFESTNVDLEVIKLDSQIKDVISNIQNITDLLDTKADNSSVYTKDEVNSLISQVNHLTRKVFNSIGEAEAFAESQDYPENFIYMIKDENSSVENNKYTEYLYVDGNLEAVGSWQTDLSNYVTVQSFNTTVSNIESILNGKAETADIININNSINTLSSQIITTNSRVENIEKFLNNNNFIQRDEYDSDIGQLRESLTWVDL